MDAMRNNNRQKFSSPLAPFVGITLVAILVATAVDFAKDSSSSGLHHGRRLEPKSSPALLSFSSFKSSKDDSKSIDDDITRDDACRDYLMNFLNGTTDAKDECSAMYKVRLTWLVLWCVVLSCLSSCLA